MKRNRSLHRQSGATLLEVLITMLVVAVGLLGAAGKEVTEAGAAAIAKQTVKQVALDYAKHTTQGMTVEGLTEATQAAAVLATTTDEAELTAARNRFWALYWGELAMVENGGVSAEAGGVESAMVAYGRCLKQACEQTELQRLALNLAHACRDSLAVSWGVTDWQAPVYTP